MDGEIGEPLFGASAHAVPDELRGEHPIATLAGHIVRPVMGQEQPASEQPQPTLAVEC